MKRLIALIMSSLGLLVVTPASALAATCGSVTTSVDYSCGNSGNGIIIDFLIAIVKYLGGLVGLLVVLMIIIGGVQYITSAGNPKGVEAAKSRITNAIIALVLYILMFGILNYLIPGTFIV